ncbi:MAG: undecaprenyl-diphosphate phosphatase [Phycisphaerales bacterium]
MQIWQAAILGVVEGLTEYLPVSSTGHLIITSALLGLDEPADVKQATDTFNIVIQGGAILAVLGLYASRVRSMIAGLLGRDADGRRLAFNIIVAFIPAVILGLLLEEAIEAWLFKPLPVIIALALGGVLLLVLGPWQRRQFARVAGEASESGGADGDADGDGDAGASDASFRSIDQLNWRHALIIGLMQCVAMIPGTSRSMMTIVGGMVVGLRPKDAAEFSFLLGLPTLGGACVYKVGKELMRSGDEANMFEVLGAGPIIVGLIAATISAALAVKWFVGYLGRRGMGIFGWYRIALAGVLAALWMGGIVFK